MFGTTASILSPLSILGIESSDSASPIGIQFKGASCLKPSAQ